MSGVRSAVIQFNYSIYVIYVMKMRVDHVKSLIIFLIFENFEVYEVETNPLQIQLLYVMPIRIFN